MSNNLENIKQVTPKCGFADKAGNIHKTKQDAYRVNLELELAPFAKGAKILCRSTFEYWRYKVC